MSENSENKNVKKVLVFPCGSEIGLEIHNALKYSTHVELFGASSVANHGKFVYANYIESLPNVDDEDFIEKLNEVVAKNNIDLIIPAHDSVVLKLAQNESKIKCKIVGSSAETCDICRSKAKTYKVLRDTVNVPHTYNENDVEIKFPVFLKPDIGQGSRGTHIANSREEIEFYREKDSSLLVLEYLPGEEYTIDCFTDKAGVLKFAAARKRCRISNGISVNTYPINEPIFKTIAKKINKKMVFRGAWFFQIKINKEGLHSLLEVAPRIAGSMALYRNMGINFVLLSIFDALDVPVSIECNNAYDIEMDRALVNRFTVGLKYEHVYIDFDDTIIFKGRVNPYVMMFLYQCVNENIKIHLLSRHNEHFGKSAQEALNRYKIPEIFDSVIDVKKNEKKSDYIQEKNSIFVDDSFTERKDVADKLKIPVFEVSSLESLINWKQ